MSSMAVTAPLIPTDLVLALKRAWREGARPDAAGALREYPSLVKHRSLFVDLAYEEYCLREEAGAAPETEAFCRQLPAFQSEVREVLRGHRVLADHPELFEQIDVAWPVAGAQFEGFTIVRELGRGAFARAYLAVDPDTGSRPVVLKLSPMPSGEARLLGTIRHAHVAEVLWARRVGNLSAICLRFEGAATLRDVVAAAFDRQTSAAPAGRTILATIASIDEGLPATAVKSGVVHSRQTYADAIAAIAERLAGALVYLHERDIIHGDLKPSNVLLGAGGHPFLIDFNLSGAAGASLDRFGGTLPYMAPECLRRMLGSEKVASLPGERSDVYSFGAVLFEALTGRLPFEPISGDDMNVVASDLLGKQVADTSSLKMVNVPSRLARLVRGCLVADPSQRPSAADLQQQLQRFLNRHRLRQHCLIAAVGSLAIAAGSSQLPIIPSTQQTVASIGASPVAEPTTPDGHIDRGLELLERKMFSAAETQFLEANGLRPNARVAALIGYCRSKLGDDSVAVHWYKTAVERDHAQPPWVYNNLAFSLIQVGAATKSLLIEADNAASGAIGQDDKLTAPFHNRAWARYLANLDRKKRCLSDPNCLPDLEADLAQALRDRTNPDLFLLAALVHAAASDGNPQRLDIAMSMLKEGIRCGLTIRRIKTDLTLIAALGKRRDFQALESLPTDAVIEPEHNSRLIEPSMR